MQLTVVGCSGSTPGPDGPASCYLVEADGYRLLLDLGSGALGALQRVTDVLAVDALALSHLHPDHCLDACPLYVVRHYGPAAVTGSPLPPLPVWAPAGAPGRLAHAYDPTGSADPPGLAEQFSFGAWRAGEPVRLGPFTVRAEPVRHTVEAYALRVSAGGRSLTYSGDTDACPALVELARDADLFLCEASYAEDGHEPGVHLSGRGAGEQATRAGARRLLLTHVPPWTGPGAVLAAAGTAYAGPLELARPGATYEV